jgi:hypothetical protein
MLSVQQVKLDGTPQESNKINENPSLQWKGHIHFPNSTGNMEANSIGCDMQTNAASM